MEILERKSLALASLSSKMAVRVYSHFAGRRHIGASSGGKDEPVTRNTRFRVASVSKTVTGLAVMQLVQEGKIQLDEDISHYLGYSLRNPNAPTVPITVRMLLSPHVEPA